MTKLAWKPWHKVVQLRDDLRTGELAMSLFAADLHDVVMGRARPVYNDPREFFALTYPTFNLRQLARDVAVRLAGQSDKAVRQLELTYGGGKTHTLITLFHLFRDPAALPDLPAVKEFLSTIGQAPPKALAAVLPFDKLDVEKGMEVRGPAGELRWLRHPWSVLAFQLAGTDGLRRLHPDGLDAERDSAPAEPLLVDLLAEPGRRGLATLVLIDETLMFAREKVGLDPAWRGKLVNFFQYLTQAATKVDHCAVVASLLATDPRRGDALGKELINELYAIFRREREEGVQPVLKEDVAEVLRRRFFTPESIRDRDDTFRPHVTTALKGIADHDEQTRRDGKIAEERFLASYPFHPDLTEVLYGKWTALESFQRTRGVLRTFALALRDAERWDTSPLVGVNVFLGDIGRQGLSEAARELATVATTEEYEGKRQEWAMILEGELSKAREIQNETPLAGRELEQAVFATFLHSQPIGQKAVTRDLAVLLAATRPDRIELEKGLKRWAEVSWFLDEGALTDVEATGAGRALPKSWRLGSRPNLTQMHHDACTRVQPDLIDVKLLAEISRTKSLTAGVRELGVKPHVLPEKPRDIEDDGDFHFAILGPSAASSSGNPSAEARRYLDEKTSKDNPRVFRNAVVLAVPSREGLDVARMRIRDYLGWVTVQDQLKDQDVDPLRAGTLAANLEGAKKKIPEAIQLMYGIVVTVSDKNEDQAFKLTLTPGEPLFGQIREDKDKRARIHDAAIPADALLPDGPYNLWREGETARRVKDLVGAFAQFPHLPKMLRAKGIFDTLVQGAKEGFFVLRLVRPDHTAQTFWRQEPPEAILREPGLEVMLPEAAELTDLSPALLQPDALPGLWTGDRLTVLAVREYFAGGKVVRVQRQGYEEALLIPRASQEAIDAGVMAAVSSGKLWLTAGPVSLCGEPVPPGLPLGEAVLQPPPMPLPPSDLLPARLGEAWTGDTASASGLAEALSAKAGAKLPWPTIQAVLSGAFQARLLERTVDSAPWPCDAAGASAVLVRVPGKEAERARVQPPLDPAQPRPGVRQAQAELRASQVQDLAEQIGELGRIAVGCELKYHLRIELGGKAVTQETLDKLNKLLADVSSELRLQ